MRYHLTPDRMAIINKSTNRKHWHGCGERETLVHHWWEYRLVQPLWEAVWRYIKNIYSLEHYSVILTFPNLNLPVRKDSGPLKLFQTIPAHNFLLFSHPLIIWDFPLIPQNPRTFKHYAKWNKPIRERQIPYDLTHMWNLMNTLN